MTYWQIGSGSEDRSYAQEMLDFGMAFVGDHETMEKVEKNHYIILRSGLKEIIAVGRATKRRDGEKEWLRDFDGWDLSAYCYVEWHKPDQPVQTETESKRQFARSPISQVRIPELKQLAKKTYDNEPLCETQGEPAPTRDVTDDEISNFLVQQGWRAAAATRFVQELKRICSLADYYYDFGYPWKEIKEHEIRTFLIVPLLLALGWTGRKIKIELSPGDLSLADKNKRKSIDVACFSTDYQHNGKEANQENCKLLIESKRFSSGIREDAPKQVKDYAKDLNCKVVLVSNGYCYKAYCRNAKNEFSDVPTAYLNIRAPKHKYPLNPKVEGALELLRYLLPDT